MNQSIADAIEKARPEVMKAAAENAPISDLISPLFDGIYTLDNDIDNNKVFEVFHSLPDRSLTTYYKVIKRPLSLTQIKRSMPRYRNIQNFIHDLAQITYNARLFNMKGSGIYNDAVFLDGYLNKAIEVLRETNKFSNDDLAYPVIGPLPEGSDVEMEFGSDSSEDDMSDDSEDDDDDGRRKSRRKSVRTKKKMDSDSQRHRMDEMPRKRGRPPIVDKPHEYRIKAILRGVRKARDEQGLVRSFPFEKLPEKRDYPEYYQEIAKPIALDNIKKNIKRRKYDTVEAFLNDMNLMFANARQFNMEGSQIYNDAMILQQEMMLLADEEMRKPDSTYQDLASRNNNKTSRLPLDSVQHRGDTYRVGDWVHIHNMNDPSKPTIGQIFRIWQAPDGQKWVNACWYYRPEQTVHRVDKVFYENEVVKSGQYRDHLVDEILEKCFVMFFTRYQRGRPQGIGDRMVYLCESRYNEVEKTFNKIRTWKACIPDEVDSLDYAMDLFEKVQPLRRLPSPIKHTLAPGAREDDPVPEATLGVENAPPVIGAVYRRPYDPSDPPEEPTPADEYIEPPQFQRTNNNNNNNHNIPGDFASPQPHGMGGKPGSAHMAPRPAPEQQSVRTVVPGNSALHPHYTPAPLQHIQMQGPVPVHAQPIGPVGEQQIFQVVGPPVNFTLPEPVQQQLSAGYELDPETNEPSKVARWPTQEKTMAVQWFISPPVHCPDTFEPSKDTQMYGKLKLSRSGEPPTKMRIVRVGHSAKYLAFKAKKKAAAEGAK